MKLIKFKEWYGVLKFGKYGDGSTAMVLVDGNTEEPIAKCTVCVDGECPAGMILVKNWSENKGMLEALEAAGIVRNTGETIAASRYVSANVCELLVDPKDFA